MEIITYVLEGEIVHKDRGMGNGSTIRPGDVQRMTKLDWRAVFGI